MLLNMLPCVGHLLLSPTKNDLAQTINSAEEGKPFSGAIFLKVELRRSSDCLPIVVKEKEGSRMVSVILVPGTKVKKP